MSECGCTHLLTSHVLYHVVCLDQLKHVRVVTVVTVIHLKSHDGALLQAHYIHKIT